MTDTRRTGNTQQFKMVCTGNNAMTAEGEVTHAGTSYTGKMRMFGKMEGQNVEMSQTFSGEDRIAGDCHAARYSSREAGRARRLALATPHTSRLRTPSAFPSMNARRGSTSSPISLSKISSDAIAVLDLHLEQPAHRRVHRRLPELLGIHLAQALVALDRDAAARLGEQPVERFLERLDRLLLVAALDRRARLDQPLQHVGRRRGSARRRRSRGNRRRSTSRAACRGACAR